jgi:phytoene dehydrogenase-like protein
VIDQLERFAPGLRERIVARHVRTPADLAAYNPNYVGGDIITGAQHAACNRLPPAHRARPLRHRHPGVYICSAATPPGAGAHGMNGYNAAPLGACDAC